MKKIVLQPKQSEIPDLNFIGVRLDDWLTMNSDEIGRWRLPSQGQEIEVGEVWSVAITPLADDPLPALEIHGDCQSVNGLGHQHRRGTILVQGNIGRHCGACMLGGVIKVQGNAGDHLGAAVGTRGVGMNGGILHVSGHAGHLAGHRMRRGELTVDGNVGDGVASWQVAGTIRVRGHVGKNVAYGMRRGTLILENSTRLPAARFTEPIELNTPFAHLIGCHANLRNTWSVCRGDRSIGGIGEVWMGSEIESIGSGTSR